MEDGEFVASQAGDGVAGGGNAAQPFGNLAQQGIANRMAKGVIDLLEAVQVEIEHGRWQVAGAEAAQGLRDAVPEQQPVGHVGQGIMPGHVDHAILGAMTLGDIFEGTDPSALGGRLARHHQHCAIGHVMGVVAEDGDVVLVACRARAMRIVGQQSGLDEVEDRRARRRRGRVQPENAEEARIADDDAIVGIEQAEAQRHRIEGGIEAGILQGQGPLLLLQGFLCPRQ